MPRPDDNIIKILALTLDGDAFGLTMYTNRHHKIVAFPQAPPRVPPTTNQIFQRDRLRTIALTWRLLTAPQRAMWAAAARFAHLSITGYNLYTVCKMRNDWSYALTVSAQSGIPLAMV